MKTCACGCGQVTPRAKTTDRSRNRRAGEQVDYIRGHNTRHTTGDSIENMMPMVRIDQDSECWNWTGQKEKGYGVLSRNGRKVYAHRRMYELTRNEILNSRFQIVRHTCDNPSCVNPGHLIIGTHKDNRLDAKERGRIPRGESSHLSRITEDVVRRVRADRRSGLTYREIAERNGISESNAHHIVSGYSWSHVED